MPSTLTYTQMADNAHRSGGTTQTEATALMSDKILNSNRRGQVGFLNSILRTLDKEAAAATRMDEYDEIKIQRLRVREALRRKDAL